MKQRIARLICYLKGHRFRYGTLLVREDLPNTEHGKPPVECLCLRCGKVLRATHGLDLDGEWVWK